MTIAKTDARKQYAGNDSTVAFSFPYRFFADGDLQVYLLVDATGIETLQTLTTHYSVSNAGDETGGTVTMVTAPATGETLTILRSIPQTQGTDYEDNDAFPAETHEAALDKLTLLLQQANELFDRTLTAPASDSSNLELPLAADRVDRVIGFNSSGDLVMLTDAGLISTATIAEYRNNTADKILNTDTTWGAMAEVALIDAVNISWDMDDGIDFIVTLAGNRTLDNPTNVQVGKKGRIRVVQDGTGSRTLAFGSNFEFARGTAITLTTDIDAEDILFYDVISATRILIILMPDVS